MKGPWKKGDVVRSVAGHDSGRRFVILEVIDEQYVLIADGKTRTVEKPKKKKNKHLRAVSGYQMEIDPNTKLQNSELHKFLKACDENLA